MAKVLKLATPVLALTLAWFVPGHAKEKQHAPLPKQLMVARTVYIENRATADTADKAYEELKKWGRFEVVTERAKADLILPLPINPELKIARGTGRVHKYTKLEALDPRTRELLYSDVEKSGGSVIKELRKGIDAQK